MARANSEFFRYLLTVKSLRHTHIVFTPPCTLCAWTPRHYIRCYSSLKHLAVVIQLHTLCLGLYFFVHSSHYDFSPSRLLELWFEALCGMSYCAFVNCWRQIPCCSFTISHFLDSNFSASHLMQLWLCIFSCTLRTMTSHLRAYCNSGLKHFAVCLIAHSSIVDGRFPVVRLELIIKINCKQSRTS